MRPKETAARLVPSLLFLFIDPLGSLKGCGESSCAACLVWLRVLDPLASQGGGARGLQPTAPREPRRGLPEEPTQHTRQGLVSLAFSICPSLPGRPVSRVPVSPAQGRFLVPMALMVMLSVAGFFTQHRFILGIQLWGSEVRCPGVGRAGPSSFPPFLDLELPLQSVLFPRPPLLSSLFKEIFLNCGETYATRPGTSDRHGSGPTAPAAPSASV